MNKSLHSIYLFANSVLLFGCLLAVGKGFDLSKILTTKPGTTFLIVMFISTFVVMFLVGRKRVDLPKSQSAKFKFNNFEVERELVENFLSDLIHRNDEKLKVSYKLIDTTIKINIAVKKLNDLKIASLVDQLKETVETGLEDKFGVKKEFKLEFNVEENKVKEEENGKKTEK